MDLPRKNRIWIKMRHKKDKIVERDGESYEPRHASPKPPPRTPPPPRPSPVVTDHAVIRFLERYMGMNVQSVRELMLSEGRGDLIKQLRSGRFPIGEKLKLVAKDGIVITVAGPED